MYYFIVCCNFLEKHREFFIFLMFSVPANLGFHAQKKSGLSREKKMNYKQSWEDQRSKKGMGREGGYCIEFYFCKVTIQNYLDLFLDSSRSYARGNTD